MPKTNRLFTAIMVAIFMTFGLTVNAAPAAKKNEATKVEKEEKAKKADKAKRKAVRKTKRSLVKYRATHSKRQRRQMLGLGPVLMIPTDGSGAAGGFSGNFSFVQMDYFIKRGGSFTLYPRIRIGSRVELHLFGIGVTMYHGKPFSAQSINRWWDINFKAGIDVRIWKGIELRTGATWFLPNPKAIINQVNGLVDTCQEGVSSATNNSNPTTQEEAEARMEGARAAQATCQDSESQGRDMLDDILTALKRPHVFISIVYTFDFYKGNWKK